MTSIVANIFHNIEKKCYSDFFASNSPETNHLKIAYSHQALIFFFKFLIQLFKANLIFCKLFIFKEPKKVFPIFVNISVNVH